MAWMITPLLGFSFTSLGTVSTRITSSTRILTPQKISITGLGRELASAL